MTDLFWINEQLAIAARPRGGDWLGDDLAALRRSGVDVLVSCLMPAEAQDLELTEEPEAAQRARLDFLVAPLEDRSAPTSVTALDEITGRLIALMRRGERVAIHCRQGLGRSPLLAAAILVRSGWSAEEAWAAVEQARGQAVPDTPEQRAWVERLAASLRPGPDDPFEL